MYKNKIIEKSQLHIHGRVVCVRTRIVGGIADTGSHLLLRPGIESVCIGHYYTPPSDIARERRQQPQEYSAQRIVSQH